jgi:hypothetical protein
VIGRIVGSPCRDLVAKLHLGADDLSVLTRSSRRDDWSSW